MWSTLVKVWLQGEFLRAGGGQCQTVGGAARGLRYQYLRTLEALMNAVEQPALGGEAVHIEGPIDPGGLNLNNIDYELSDVSGHIVSAVQVKARASGSAMGPGEIFGALAGLVLDRDATQYELLTNAEAGDRARKLVAVLSSELDPQSLCTAIDTILASVSAERPQGSASALDDDQLARLEQGKSKIDA